MKHLEPLFEGLEIIGIAGMFQGAIHTVDERQDVPEQILVAVLNRVRLLPDGAFPVIVELGDGAHIFVVIFRGLLLRFLKFHHQIFRLSVLR